VNLTLVTDATTQAEPLQVSDAQTFLVIDPSNATANLQEMITAARLEAENENGRELARKQYKLVLDRFPTNGHFWNTFGASVAGPYYGERPYNSYAPGDGRIALLDPLVSVDSFTYRKSDGTVVTLAEDTNYLVDADKHPGELCPPYGQQWPTDTLWPASPIQITFTVGFTPAQVPAVVKNGMKLLISEWYENRLPFTGVRFVAELPYSVRSAFQYNKLWKF
jgi:hypothetical protein